VLQCAVIAIPDDTWGEIVHACVVFRQGTGLTLDELQTHCRESIANYKIPRSLEVMNALPLSGAGKVLKAQLRERFWAGRARRVG